MSPGASAGLKRTTGARARAHAAWLFQAAPSGLNSASLLQRVEVLRPVRVVAHLPDFLVVQVHLLLLLEIERPCPDAAEDAELIAALVHCPVAVHALADRERVAAVRYLVGRDQLRRRTRAEA